MHALGCTVRIVDVAGLNLPPKGDAVDWLAMHQGACATDIAALPLRAAQVQNQIQNQTRIDASEAGDASGAAQWPEPKPMHAPLKPVPAFDAATLLPDVLADWVMDEADRMQCPPDFIAASVMVALGSLVGARCAIKPKAHDNWQIVPNFWGGIVGVPSVKKSPAMNAALKPLEILTAREAEAFQCVAKRLPPATHIENPVL